MGYINIWYINQTNTIVFTPHMIVLVLCRVVNLLFLLFSSSLFRSKLLKKSNREGITLDFFLKKSKVNDLLVICGNCSQKTSDSLKTYFWYFLTVYHGFSLFLCPRVNHFHRYLLSFSF